MYAHNNPKLNLRSELVLLDEKYENKSLFDVIYDFALANNMAGLKKLMADGHGLQLRVYHSQYFHTPASLLAARGKHDAVKLLFELEIGTLDSIVYGYALSLQISKVEEYITIGASLDAALCGYVASHDVRERDLLDLTSDPDAKFDLTDADRITNNIGFDVFVEDMLNRGASIDVAVMAYAKAVKVYANYGNKAEDEMEHDVGYNSRVYGLILRGANSDCAIYGYAQRAARFEIIEFYKNFVPPNKHAFNTEYYYRLALGQAFIDDADASRAYKSSMARGYAQANIFWEEKFNSFADVVNAEILGHALSGRSQKVSAFIIANPWAGFNFNVMHAYAHGGNFSLAEATGFIFPGRNLYKVGDCIKRANRARLLEIFNAFTDFNAHADFRAASSLRKNLLVKLDMGFLQVGYHHRAVGNQWRSHFFAPGLVSNTGSTRAVRMFELQSELKLSTNAKIDKSKEIKAENNLHSEAEQKTEQLVSYNQVYAWTDPVVQISIQQQLLLASLGEEGCIPGIFLIILQYLTPISYEEAGALVSATKPNVDSEAKYFANVIQEKLRAWGPYAKFETLNHAKEIPGDPGLQDAVNIISKKKMAEIEHFELTQGIVEIIKNYQFWHGQLSYSTITEINEFDFATPNGKIKIPFEKVKTIDFKIAGETIKIPLFIHEMNDCINEYPDWKKDVKAMNAMREKLKSIAIRSESQLCNTSVNANYLYYLFYKLDPNNTRIDDLHVSVTCIDKRWVSTWKEKNCFVSLAEAVSRAKVSVKYTRDRLSELTNQYICQNKTEETMINSLKACLREESKSDDECLADIKKYAEQLAKIKKEPKQITFQHFLKAAWDIVSLVIFPIAIYRARESKKLYNTYQFWKPANVRMRDCAQDTINQLLFQQPASFLSAPAVKV